MRTEEEIETIVTAKARRSFDDDVIVGIRVNRDVDHDGDPIFWVRIIVEPEFMELDAKFTLAFAVGLRTDLIKLGELAFPVIDYIVRDDAEKFDAKAA